MNDEEADWRDLASQSNEKQLIEEEESQASRTAASCDVAQATGAQAQLAGGALSASPAKLRSLLGRQEGNSAEQEREEENRERQQKHRENFDAAAAEEEEEVEGEPHRSNNLANENLENVSACPCEKLASSVSSQACALLACSLSCSSSSSCTSSSSASAAASAPTAAAAVLEGCPANTQHLASNQSLPSCSLTSIATEQRGLTKNLNLSPTQQAEERHTVAGHSVICASEEAASTAGSRLLACALDVQGAPNAAHDEPTSDELGLSILGAASTETLATAATMIKEIALGSQHAAPLASMEADELGDEARAFNSHEANEGMAAAAMEEPAVLLLEPFQHQQSSQDDDYERRCSASTPPPTLTATPLQQPPATRLERSNSCSQAENVPHAAELLQADGGALEGASPIAIASASTTAAAATTPTSTEPKLSASSSCISILGASARESERGAAGGDPLNKSQQQLFVGSYAGRESSKSWLLDSSRLQAQAAAAVSSFNKQQTNVYGATSRFFSSKLNTGSLWSLLSASGANSESNSQLDELCNTSQPAEQIKFEQLASTNDGQAEAPSIESGGGGGKGKQPIQLELSRSTSSFFSRQFQFQHFKRPSQGQENPSNITSSALVQQQAINAAGQQQALATSNNQALSAVGLAQAQSQMAPARKRHRFNIKYIGNTLLHKNFTLPMLEWIAKDIKRQTVRGALGINQRQFSIPARDIVFEIQSNQLTAISCKDGQCIFVHPMHCVSKYAQLQHDPTCFAYIIRDSKDAPSFCHVFQAKSTTKVHEIFTAVREATTSRATHLVSSGHLLPASEAATAGQQQQHQQMFSSSFSSAARGLQKSASTDGHWRSLLGGGGGGVDVATTPLAGNYSAEQSAGGAAQQVCAPAFAMCATANPGQQVATAAATLHADQAAASVQFENSYQFEVMFVKRVKLQCRRVPASFVDDALETLKTFEMPKAQTKSVVSKRIINASVDERQEYDEQQVESAATCSVVSGATRPSDEEQRRGSSASLNPGTSSTRPPCEGSKSCQQSPAKVCGVGVGSGGTSSVKHQPSDEDSSSTSETPTVQQEQQQQQQQQSGELKKHQSMDCLKSIDYDSVIQSAKTTGQPPAYANDFSPYNTITSSDLNERIAAIPVVSGSSVSLDHETRQKLARQVRETIMATAANIKKGVYASGDKLDSSSSCKALDSLSCNVIDAVPLPTEDSLVVQDSTIKAAEVETRGEQTTVGHQEKKAQAVASEQHTSADESNRRQTTTTTLISTGSASSAAGNNFDLFRRASARQVVKNRTMLLLIGKDELCAISIDKHQMLFSKSFNSIVHCLQGINNRDHFGLICRDSAKINPQAESYAGFVFKCQSEKVVREIMGALRQVIYNSQHNYHGHDSPYNPLNSVAISAYCSAAVNAKQSAQLSPKLERLGRAQTRGVSLDLGRAATSNAAFPEQAGQVSLAAKRGFTAGQLGVGEASGGGGGGGGKQNIMGESGSILTSVSGGGGGSGVGGVGGVGGQMIAPATAPVRVQHQPALQPALQTFSAPKNPIKSMFCDNCPLYWYHRLCCDIESLSAEASKSIILRRIDSSLGEKDQDEVYSRFSDFKIDSIEQHNEIFMSILRHQCERKQLRHNQSQAHQAAMAKQMAAESNLAQQQQQRRSASMQRDTSGCGAIDSMFASGAAAAQATKPLASVQLAAAAATAAATAAAAAAAAAAATTLGARPGHQRSGSSSGSLAVMQQQQQQSSSSFSQARCESLTQHQQQQQQLLQNGPFADASSAAIDNLKRAKNSISVSIENMLKRRSSLAKEDEAPQQHQQEIGAAQIPISRAGSFKGSPRCSTLAAASNQQASGCSSRLQQTTGDECQRASGLKRSQSSTDYAAKVAGGGGGGGVQVANWRDSILSRTFNATDVDLTTPLVGFFRRRGSFASQQQQQQRQSGEADSKRTSTESLVASECNSGTTCRAQLTGQLSPARQQQQQQQQQAAATGGSSPSHLLSGSFWKKNIFDKIHQPTAASQPSGQTPAPTIISPSRVADGQRRDNDETRACANRKKSRDELRSLWQKAIREQITLLKMDKQNQALQMRKRQEPSAACPCDETPPLADDRHPSNIKLNYRDVPHGREVAQQWSNLLRQDPTKKVEFVLVARLVRLGVPKRLRGEIWMFLMNQYQLRHGTSFQPADSEYRGDANQTYRSLLSQLSLQQHEIFVDIGRTFPTHPYYSQYLSIGQLSLFNLLKAYSLLDQEVGYCQGLSFVAGILLLHVDSEDEAFELMRHLLFNFGLRKQYLPSMNALHLQLYQITRLLRDHEYDIFNHFDRLDISPSLYAAPWFLTLFATQFPLGFVSRLLDLIFLIGIEAIFRVSLTLLTYHKAALLRISSLEHTMEFLRNDLVKIDDRSLVKLFDEFFSLDLRNKLIEYEIEYSFYCAEDKARSASGQHSRSSATMEQQKRLAMASRNTSDDSIGGATNMSIRPVTETNDKSEEADGMQQKNSYDLIGSEVADATATVIIQHLLANNHLRSIRSDYSY